MEKEKNEKMTLDKLAVMVARGFEKTASKEDLKEVETRMRSKLEEHDTRFGKLEYRIDEIHEILNRFEEGDIMDLQKRIKILERAVKAMSKQL